MTQHPLPPFQRASETSRAAAIAAAPKASTQKALILAYLHDCAQRGATEDEIEVSLGFLRSAICARVNSLVHAGLVRDSGERRETRWKRQAVVWVATSK